MPKENIFSGKYEPDRDTCTEANEDNVARFRIAMLKLDRIHNDENEKDGELKNVDRDKRFCQRGRAECLL